MGVLADRLADLAAQVRALEDAHAPPPPPPPPPPLPPPPVAEQSAILRVIRLGQTGPMMASIAPVQRNEHSTYNRRDPLAMFLTRTITSWTWVFAQGQEPTPRPRCRMLVDGTAVTDWQAATAFGDYRFDAIVVTGWHVAYVECEDREVVCFAVPFIVNDTGAPLPGPAEPWAATARFEYNHGGPLPPGSPGHTGNVAVQVRHGPAAPVIKPLKPRVIETYSALLPKDQLWVRHQQANNGSEFTRRWALAPTGDLVIETDQKYFHSTAVSHYPANGQIIDTWPARSGPRGQGTLLYVCDMRLRRSPVAGKGNGIYFAESNGRFAFMGEDGRVTTLVGLHLPTTPIHAGVKSGTYMHRLTRPGDAALYDSKFVEAADWSQVQGSHRLWEPWGFEVLDERDDGSIVDRDGHEFWIADTLNHRIVFGDHWTAHSQAKFAPARLAPPWYVQAPGPTGKTTMANFVGSTDGTPTEACNEPWQIKYNPRDGKLYWSNFAGNSIYRCNLDGSGIEDVIESALHPTDVQLGLPQFPSGGGVITQRLSQSKIDPIELRKTLLVDGPLGTATCVRPTAIAFDSQGRLLWVEHYTYAVRRLDLTTGIVQTLCTIIDVNGGSASSGNNEPNMVIDTEGTCGPVDDIFVWAWSNGTDRRYSADGVRRGKPWTRIFTQSSSADMRNGPLSQASAPNYGWGLDVFGGRIVAVGSAAGSQMIEITKRQPDDPAPDIALWERGRLAWLAAGVPQVALGPGGQGELGLPTYEEMAGWDDAKLAIYLASVGVDDAAAVAYYVRWAAVDHAVMT